MTKAPDYSALTGTERSETMAVQCPKCFKMPGSVCVSSLGKPYRRQHLERWQKAAARKVKKK